MFVSETFRIWTYYTSSYIIIFHPTPMSGFSAENGMLGVRKASPGTSKTVNFKLQSVKICKHCLFFLLLPVSVPTSVLKYKSANGGIALVDADTSASDDSDPSEGFP